MSWLICGTIPDTTLDVQLGTIGFTEDSIIFANKKYPILRGSLALVAAAYIVAETLGKKTPLAMLAGDTGHGNGSKMLYEHLCVRLSKMPLRGITFHYLLPDIDWQLRILHEIESLSNRPLLVADAGYMYAVKMSGCAQAFDLFTPDSGELAFLADENAPHPFYTRGFLLADDGSTTTVLDRAVETGGAAQHLLIKGETDYIVEKGNVVAEISTPSIPAMEAIGGTGDTVTGIVTALISSGMPITQACIVAAKTNRIMGELAKPTPATQVVELLKFLPEALEQALQSNKANTL